ncbi:MAG: DUF72 domain-containing protein [bacterium]
MTCVFIGTSGWSYNHWEGRFYPSGLPSKERFSFYASKFQTVEVNASFYRLPFEGMIKGWYKRSPVGFQFALKAPRRITHLLKLVDCREFLKVFLERIKGLSEKLGVILYQLPPSLKKDIPRLEAFIAQLPSGFRYAIEFRDNSWVDEATFNLLRKNGIAYCIVSAPKLITHLESTTDFVYLRFHGISDWYRYDYSKDELAYFAESIKDFVKQELDVYCYFNNDFDAYAVKNAKELMELVG